MEMSIAKQKQLMRKEMRTKRDALLASEKSAYDQIICRKLEDSVIQRNFQTIHCYLPMGSEIDITIFIQNMLAQGRTIICPKTLRQRKLEHLQLQKMKDVEYGLWNTTHPIGNQVFTGKLDLIIVPGLAFDKQNYRLGYGGGYYDSFLSDHHEAFKVGLSYPFQVVDQVPREAHDVQLDEVIILIEQ